MPMYVYQCRECREKFETLRGINDSDENLACPRCGKKNPERVIAAVCGGSNNASRGNLQFPT